MTPEQGKTVLAILAKRCGEWTTVVLADGRALDVFNIAWGYDLGAEYPHITTNVSPEPPGPHTIDFFHTNEVIQLEDTHTGKCMWSME